MPTAGYAYALVDFGHSTSLSSTASDAYGGKLRWKGNFDSLVFYGGDRQFTVFGSSTFRLWLGH